MHFGETELKDPFHFPILSDFEFKDAIANKKVLLNEPYFYLIEMKWDHIGKSLEF
jgi:hypothetical protein